MKKIIKKFWGVAFVLVLLSTLLVGALPQASAGVLCFTWETLPGGMTGGIAFNPQGITSFGETILDFSVAGDGVTIYAATMGNIFGGAWKSFDGGRSWIPLMGVATAGAIAPTRVAVAPDNPNLVAYLDYTVGIVVLSTDGGMTFSSAGAPRDGGGTAAVLNSASDIQISKRAVVEGVLVNLIAVNGVNGVTGAPGLFYINYGAAIAVWRDAADATGGVLGPNAPIAGQGFTPAAKVNMVAFKFSPNFDQDFIAYAISDNGTNTYLEVVSFNSNRWNSGIPGFLAYNNAGTGIAALGVAIANAQIVFDPAYYGGDEAARIAYASFATLANTGGVYRMTDNAGPIVANLGAFVPIGVAIWSIDVNSDGSLLVAAAAQSSTTWTAAGPSAPNPLFVVWTPSRVIKRSGGGVTYGVSTATDNMTIAYGGASVFLARGSTQGAFALSIDNAFTFNDISKVNTLIFVIDDQVVSPDGTQRYIVSSDNNGVAGGNTSVFYYDGMYWSRVLTLGNSDGYMAQASPNNFSILYMGKMTNNAATNLPGTTIFYTSDLDSGQSNWLMRMCPIPNSVLVDMEVQDDTTLYVATNQAGNGWVTKLTNTGLLWPVGPPYYTQPFGPATTVGSLTLVATDQVIVGSAAGFWPGSLAYTANGGAFWTMIGTSVGGVAGTAYGTATSLATGSVIYGTTTASPSVFMWTIGTSTSWGTAVWTATANSRDLQIYNGAIYQITSAANTHPTLGAITDTTLARALLPGFFGTWASVNVSTYGVLLGPSFPQWSSAAVQPYALKFSEGNVVYWIENVGSQTMGVGPFNDQIISFQDTLAYTTPTVISPEDGVVIPVNKETGIAYNTTLVFAAASLALQYQVQVAYDAAFTNIFGNVLINVVIPGTNVNVIIGPLAGANLFIQYQPGETYYWRVRATLPFPSPWTAGLALNVMPIPSPIPELLQPDTSSVVDTLRPGFSWTPMAVSDTYTFELATDPDFMDMVYTVDTTSTGVQLSADLVDGTQYFWRVKVLTSVNDGWSTVGNFRVQLPTEPVPPVNVTENPVPTINLTQAPVEQTASAYIWAIIVIGAVLVIAVIVLIVRTKQG